MARRKQQVLQEVLTNQEEWDNFMTKGGLSVIDCHQVRYLFILLYRFQVFFTSSFRHGVDLASLLLAYSSELKLSLVVSTYPLRLPTVIQSIPWSSIEKIANLASTFILPDSFVVLYGGVMHPNLSR